jgi:hypothetical protein
MDVKLRSSGTVTTLIPMELVSRRLFLDVAKFTNVIFAAHAFIVTLLKLTLSEHSLRTKLICFLGCDSV